MTPTHKLEIQVNDITFVNHSKLYDFIGPRGSGHLYHVHIYNSKVGFTMFAKT
jgi:hypothetical protein